MGAFTAGEIVLVPFPFSDLSSSKLRPALVVCTAEFNDIVLCQITSRKYEDIHAIEVKPSECVGGSLEMISFIRPFKLFTADADIVRRKICSVSEKIFSEVRDRIIDKINGIE